MKRPGGETSGGETVGGVNHPGGESSVGVKKMYKGVNHPGVNHRRGETSGIHSCASFMKIGAILRGRGLTGPEFISKNIRIQ